MTTNKAGKIDAETSENEGTNAKSIIEKIKQDAYEAKEKARLDNWARKQLAKGFPVAVEFKWGYSVAGNDLEKILANGKKKGRIFVRVIMDERNNPDIQAIKEEQEQIHAAQWKSKMRAWGMSKGYKEIYEVVKRTAKNPSYYGFRTIEDRERFKAKNSPKKFDLYLSFGGGFS